MAKIELLPIVWQQGGYFVQRRKLEDKEVPVRTTHNGITLDLKKTKMVKQYEYNLCGPNGFITNWIQDNALVDKKELHETINYRLLVGMNKMMRRNN